MIGGRFAELYGFKKVGGRWECVEFPLQVYGLGVLVPGLLMFLHPLAANTDVGSPPPQQKIIWLRKDLALGRASGPQGAPIIRA